MPNNFDYRIEEFKLICLYISDFTMVTYFSLNYLFNKHAISHKKLGMGIKDRCGRREREADVERKGLKSSLPSVRFVPLWRRWRILYCILCSRAVIRTGRSLEGNIMFTAVPIHTLHGTAPGVLLDNPLNFLSSCGQICEYFLFRVMNVHLKFLTPPLVSMHFVKIKK